MILGLFMLTGCSQQSTQPDSTPSPTEVTVTQTNEPQESQVTTEITDKVLIVYFSFPENEGMDTSSGASRVALDEGVVGNTQYVAQLIQERTGGDIFRIETVQEYPNEHDSLVDMADQEKEDNARPELKAVPNLDEYSVLFFGYPIWWYDFPMPVYTFLESVDMSSKTVIPFNTHGGSQFSSTLNSLEQLQSDALIEENGLTISRNNVANCTDEVQSWLNDLGY